MLATKKLVTALVGGGIAAATIATAAPAMAATLNITYDVTGSTRVGAQVNQTIPLGPSTLNINYNTDNGAFTNGKLPLPPKRVTFPVFGGLATLSATVNFIQSGTITGGLTQDSVGNNVASATAKYTIKLTDASAKPLIGLPLPLVIGNNCQTSTPASIPLKTPAGQNFDPVGGGNLAGKYTIPSFTGCNILLIPGLGSLVVNALVPGSNNTIAVTLANGR